MRRERQSRQEAEALFASLGRGPSWSQRVAAFLVKPAVWLFGFPLLLWALMHVSRAPERVIGRFWEARHHERLLHVVSPVTGWLVSVGFGAAVVIAILIWSLLGERIDARRGLQAALACKPPETAGGSARCRSCEGPLEVPAGALGVRCRFCGADNLVDIPPSWARHAEKLDTDLRLSMKVSREREEIGRRRVRRAALWRVPLVLVTFALASIPAVLRQKQAGWRDFHRTPDKGIGVDMLVIRQPHADPTHTLHSYAACDDVRARSAVLSDAQLSTDASQWCEQGACKLVAMFALARGERLRLVWSEPGPAHVRVALAEADYLGTNLVLWDGFGDAVLERDLTPTEAGTTAVDVPIAISGWYKLDLRGASGTSVEPCVMPVAP